MGKPHWTPSIKVHTIHCLSASPQSGSTPTLGDFVHTHRYVDNSTYISPHRSASSPPACCVLQMAHWLHQLNILPLPRAFLSLLLPACFAHFLAVIGEALFLNCLFVAQPQQLLTIPHDTTFCAVTSAYSPDALLHFNRAVKRFFFFLSAEGDPDKMANF